jgi:hypothetical protein
MEFQPFLRLLLPLRGDAVQGLHDQLAALTPPKAEAAGYTAYVNGSARFAAGLAREQQDLKLGNGAAVSADASRVQTLAKQLDAAGAKVPALAPCVNG